MENVFGQSGQIGPVQLTVNEEIRQGGGMNRLGGFEIVADHEGTRGVGQWGEVGAIAGVAAHAAVTVATVGIRIAPVTVIVAETGVDLLGQHGAVEAPGQGGHQLEIRVALGLENQLAFAGFRIRWLLEANDVGGHRGDRRDVLVGLDVTGLEADRTGKGGEIEVGHGSGAAVDIPLHPRGHAQLKATVQLGAAGEFTDIFVVLDAPSVDEAADGTGNGAAGPAVIDHAGDGDLFRIGFPAAAATAASRQEEQKPRGRQNRRNASNTFCLQPP